MTIRTRADVMTEGHFSQGITAENRQTLRQESANNPRFWSETPEQSKEILRKFSSEVKDYYYHAQSRRCCYCCVELQEHKRTYDYEHILCVAEHPQFAFALDNAAISCLRCNMAKHATVVLSPGVVRPPAAVPTTSGSYAVVHPHLDEWSTHLAFDRFNRIIPQVGSTKGAETIRVCKIWKLNSARLADEFRGNRKSAEKMLNSFYQVKSAGVKKKRFMFLKDLAEQTGLAPALAIVNALKDELDP